MYVRNTYKQVCWLSSCLLSKLSVGKQTVSSKNSFDNLPSYSAGNYRWIERVHWRDKSTVVELYICLSNGHPQFSDNCLQDRKEDYRNCFQCWHLKRKVHECNSSICYAFESFTGKTQLLVLESHGTLPPIIPASNASIVPQHRFHQQFLSYALRNTRRPICVLPMVEKKDKVFPEPLWLIGWCWSPFP